MKTPWKLRDKAEELFRVNRSYIHTYKTLGLLHLNLFKDFSFLWCQFVELFCYLFSCLFCLFVCLSAFFCFFFWVPSASIQDDEVFISGAWNFTSGKFAESLLVLLELVRFCFRSVDPKCWTWHPSDFSFQNKAFVILLEFPMAKIAQNSIEVFGKVRKTQHQNPEFGHYTDKVTF